MHTKVGYEQSLWSDRIHVRNTLHARLRHLMDSMDQIMCHKGAIQCGFEREENKKIQTVTRGIRQGNLFSAYLFILDADVLYCNITNAVEQQDLEGIRIKRTCSTIHHLFFADDSLCFIKASEQNVRQLMDILQTYNRALGQSINMEKSCVFFIRLPRKIREEE